MRVAAGSTDVSVIIRIVDSADGTPETGVTDETSGLALGYWREGGSAFVGLTEADLSALDDAHSDGGLLHINGGYYRVDIPDAAFATGADYVLIGGTITDMVVIGTLVEIGATLDGVDGKIDTVDSNVDSILADTGTDGVVVASIANGAITAATIATDAIDADALADDAIAAINATVDTALSDYDAPTKTELDAAVAPLATATALQTVDDVVDAIKERTDNLPNDPADDSDIDSQLSAIAGYIDTEIAAIKAVTDAIPDGGALTDLLADVASILADTDELQTDDLPGMIGAIKAVTDAIPDGGALTTLANDIAAILADTGTDGVAISEATRQAIADELLKRSVSHVEDDAETDSMTELILANLEGERSGTTFTVRKTTGETFSTRELTTDGNADPVVGIGKDDGD